MLNFITFESKLEGNDHRHFQNVFRSEGENDYHTLLMKINIMYILATANRDPVVKIFYDEIFESKRATIVTAQLVNPRYLKRIDVIIQNKLHTL